MKSRVHKDEDRSSGGHQMRCPTCKRIVKSPEEGSPAQAKFFPFCSERCKLIDLGAWLDAEYRIPSRPDDHEDVPANNDSASPDAPS